MEKELQIRDLKKTVQQNTQHLEQIIKNSLVTNAELEKEIKIYQAFKKELGRNTERVSANHQELANLQRILCEKDEALKSAEESKADLLQHQVQMNHEYKVAYQCLNKKIEATTHLMHQSGSSIKNRKDIITTLVQEKQEKERSLSDLQRKLSEVKEEVCILNQDIRNVDNQTEIIRAEDQEIKSSLNEAVKRLNEKTKELNSVKIQSQQEEINLKKLNLRQEELQKQICKSESANKALQENLTDTKEKGHLMGVENDTIAEHNEKQEVQIEKLSKMIDQNSDQIEEFQLSNAELIKKVAELEMQDTICKFCQNTIEQ